MKNSILLVCSIVFSLNIFSETLEVGSFKVLNLVSSNSKNSITLLEVKSGSGNILNIDCLDGRKPNNTILSILPGVIFKNNVNHKVFTGLSDFYCAGLIEVLLKSLSMGDIVKVLVHFKYLIETEGPEKYQLLNIQDIIFNTNGSSKSLRSSPAVFGEFMSREPVVQKNI